MKMISQFGRAVLFAFVSLSSVSAASHTLTIDEVIALSLEHSPDIDSSRFDLEGAIQRTKAAEGFYLPSVDISANAGKQYNGFKDGSRNVDLLAGTLGASQLLYDFGKTSGLVGSAKEEALAYQAQMQQVISDKIYTVKKAYYDVLKAKSIIDVQRKNVKLQKQQLHRAQRYLASGIKTIIDVSDAQVRVEQAKLDLENAKYDLELTRAILEEAIGYRPYGGNYRLYSKKLPLPNLSRNLPTMKRSLGSLEAFAYTHRYVLEGSEHIIRSAQSNVKTSQGDYYPTLSVGANYTAQHIDESVAAMQPEKQGQVALQMNWNLFSGYQTDARVQEAKIAVLKASSHRQSVKLAIKRQVIDSYIGVRRNNKNVKLSESIAKASLKKFEQAQKRYENDLSDYVELQDAQQGYIRALSDLVTAYYDYYIALAQLDHSTGR
jgi:outer membrane protein TolC